MDPRGWEQSRRMGPVPGYDSLGAAGTAFRAAPAAPAASSSHRHTLSPPKAGEISMRTARLFLGRRSELHCVTSWRARREAREGAWSARLVGEKRPFYGAPRGPLTLHSCLLRVWKVRSLAERLRVKPFTLRLKRGHFYHVLGSRTHESSVFTPSSRCVHSSVRVGLGTVGG